MAQLDAEAIRQRDRRVNRALLIAAAVIAAVVIGVLVFARISANREEAEQIDGYYCTLSGVGPLDRAPETGKLCADILSQ